MRAVLKPVLNAIYKPSRLGFHRQTVALRTSPPAWYCAGCGKGHNGTRRSNIALDNHLYCDRTFAQMGDCDSFMVTADRYTL